MSSLRFLPRASLDIEEIGLYIAEYSTDAAMRIIDRIEDVCRLLADNPMMGRSREDWGARLRSFPAEDYLVIYRPVENGVEIVRVLHAARDIGPLLEHIDDT